MSSPKCRANTLSTDVKGTARHTHPNPDTHTCTLRDTDTYVRCFPIHCSH
uniref:Uncharacterized protein n=1 Tax=Anguilla anguilla TaxID=7936 RepID=A0A0E9QCL1_ANGAN